MAEDQSAPVVMMRLINARVRCWAPTAVSSASHDLTPPLHVAMMHELYDYMSLVRMGRAEADAHDSATIGR